MNKIKVILCLFIAVLMIVAAITPVFAHSGKTDANGGHYDTATGEYHYHHGYPAHQHTNGKCPYDYDDKTDYKSRSSYKNSSNDSSPGFFSIIVSFVIWALIFGLLELCLFPFIDKIKDEEWRKIIFGGSIVILLGLALYMATTQPFF